MLGTSVIDAEPAVILQMPFDSYAPFTLAVGTAIIFIGMLYRSWPGIGVGVIVTGIALLLWLWPGPLREGSPEAADEPPFAEPGHV
jgi:cytochrome c oxidase subunit 1/cytochrome c oxidase subunit I+III